MPRHACRFTTPAETSSSPTYPLARPVYQPTCPLVLPHRTQLGSSCDGAAYAVR